MSDLSILSDTELGELVGCFRVDLGVLSGFLGITLFPYGVVCRSRSRRFLRGIIPTVWGLGRLERRTSLQ